MSTTPNASPPGTPREPFPPSSSKPASPESDDSSIIDDLSFDYGFDDKGNFIRLSKGSKNSATPPTPSESPNLPESHSPIPQDSPPRSPLHAPRGSLSRSETAYAVLNQNPAPALEAKPVRTFQRATSQPTTTGSALPSYLAPTLASQRARAGPRRITMEEGSQRPDYHQAAAIARSRAAQQLDAYTDEKENLGSSEMAVIEDQHHQQQQQVRPINMNPMVNTRRHSPPLHSRSTGTRMSSSRLAYGVPAVGHHRPLADVPVPQRAPPTTSRQVPTGVNRLKRVVKPTPPAMPAPAPAPLKRSASSADRLSEVMEVDGHQSENEYMRAPGGEDTEPEDEAVEVHQQQQHVAVAVPQADMGGVHPNGLRRRRDLNIVVPHAGSSLGHSNNRPRRSASLSEAHQHDDYQMQVVQPHGNSRPGSSLGSTGDHSGGARRVAPEERERQEMEARAAEYRALEQQQQQPRPSSSPTQAQPHLRTAHRRRDSDTVRGMNGPPSATAGSPTVNDNMPARPSPTANRYAQPQGRNSPNLRGRATPPGLKNRPSPQPAKGRASPPNPTRLAASQDYQGHRRHPTAPELEMGNGTGNGNVLRASNTARQEEYDGMSSTEKDREREKALEAQRDRERRDRRELAARGLGSSEHVQPFGTLQQQQQPHPLAATQYTTNLKHIVVNKRAYARLDMIGKGGSSRVFRVLNHANDLYAIKRVSLDKTDSETMASYMNEIALLKRLEGNNRIIRLIDSEVRPGSDGSKGHLMLVMECGEIDFARLLGERVGQALNMVWVSYYWQQMLQAVHVIHEEKIVHSDLKPANFVLVKGQLKLIDFGIANAIANDTTNIQRDHQIGTVNYMSPEAIELPDGKRRLKVGRPSDVWSLGCILYQMVYGQPPFQHLSVYHKMKAIPDAAHVIDFPEFSTPSIPAKNNPNLHQHGGMNPLGQPRQLAHLRRRVPKGVIECMKSCLSRNPKERATIPELMEQRWLTGDDALDAGPSTPSPSAAGTLDPNVNVASLLGPDQSIITPYYMRQLLLYGMSLAGVKTDGMDPDALMSEAKNLVSQLKTINMEGEQI